MSVSKEVKPFEYCDSRDGEDILQKFKVVFKPVALTAFALSTIDVMLYSHPKGYVNTLARYAHISWPVFGVATAFILGHNLAGAIRHTDDKLNWFIGGAAAGSVIGLWRRSTIGGFTAAVALGMVALGKKHAVQNGTFLLVPKEATPQYGGLRSVRQDWTLMKHRPGNWVTEESK